MTKHDDDAAERAEKRAGPSFHVGEEIVNLIERYRELESAYNVLQGKLDDLVADNASLRRDLVRATERLVYYQRLCIERFGFEPTPPPATMFHNDE